MKILIADDDRGTRLLVSAMVRDFGHHGVTAANGRQAWEEFEQEQFSVLITDWMMPELDGIELCRRIRRASRVPYTYVMVLTMLSGKTHYLTALEAGADDFMTKPVDRDELNARLQVAERILSLQRDVRQLARLLPVCMYCRKISDAERWTSLEEYIATRTETSLSHGVCPECLKTQVRDALKPRRSSRRTRKENRHD